MRGATPLAMKGGQGRRQQTTPREEGGEEPRRNPPPSPPTPPPPARGMPGLGHGSAGPLPLQGQVEVPPPERAAAPGGGMPLSQYATRPHAPTRLLSQRPQQAGGPTPAHKGATRTTPGINTRTRIGAVWRPRPP